MQRRWLSAVPSDETMSNDEGGLLCWLHGTEQPLTRPPHITPSIVT